MPAFGSAEGIWPGMIEMDAEVSSLLDGADDFYPGTGVRRICMDHVTSMHRPCKIAIAYSDTGAGHKAAALSLQAALKRQIRKQVEVELIDLIRERGSFFFALIPEYYQMLGNYPSMYKA